MLNVGWKRKWQVDVAADQMSPLPAQVVSNEEFVPLPQTRAQAQVAARFQEMARHHSGHLGLGRREFLGSACGLAAGLLAMNTVFGRFFEVDPVEALEPAAATARTPAGQFVFDVQTHHVAAPRQFPNSLGFRQMGRLWNSALEKDRGTMEDVYLANYIKEVFLDSETSIALIGGVPTAIDATSWLPVGKAAETREIVNRLAASQRLVCHGHITPNRGPSDLDEMRRQAADLKIDAWKGYTGQLVGDPPRAWRLDEEKVSYPMLETARQLGIKNVCLHKGLPLDGSLAAYWHPGDLERAARDFPDINFLVYHAGFKSLLESLDVAQQGFRTMTRVDWVTDLCEIRQRNPTLTNIYPEIGSTFAMTVISSPLLCAHILGMLVQAFGADHVLWGTDSIWWGSPQWQIEAFRRFIMPDALLQRFGYAPLTTAMKTQILGLNAARLFNIDPNAHRNAVPADDITKLRAAYRELGPSPSLTQYGWVRGV